MTVAIVGAGIIGTSIAYYLSQIRKDTAPEDIHIIEASPELFASASGHAAGFIARDWFSDSVASLGALSFDLHQQLAKDENGHEIWGYCPTTSMSLGETLDFEDLGTPANDAIGSRRKDAKTQKPAGKHGPNWLTNHHTKFELLGNIKHCAQLDPLALSQFLMSSCLSRGVQLHQPASVLSTSRNSSGAISSIQVELANSIEIAIPCNRLIIAAGAWTPNVYSKLFSNSDVRIPVYPLAGHSILIRSPLWPAAKHPPLVECSSVQVSPYQTAATSCYSIYTTDPQDYSPEFYARLPGHVYLCGLNSSSYPLPKLPTERIIDSKSTSILKATAKRLMGEDIEILRESVCWRPMATRGVPILGRMPNVEGLWLASGTGTWGISLSLGIGKVMAEMLEGKPTSADVRRLEIETQQKG